PVLSPFPTRRSSDLPFLGIRYSMLLRTADAYCVIRPKTHRRQWIRLSLCLVARHLRSTLHQPDLLQALRARGKRQVGTLAQNPSVAVLERVALGPAARAGGS